MKRALRTLQRWGAVAFLLTLSLSAAGGANPTRDLPLSRAFPLALQIYSDFLGGVSSDIIVQRYRAVVPRVPATADQALAWLLDLQARTGAERLGAGPLDTHDIKNSCYRPSQRGWDLSLGVLSHEREALAGIPNLLRRIRSSFYLLDQDQSLLACERCTLNPECREQEERWMTITGGRTSAQQRVDRDALRDACIGMANYLVIENERGFYVGDTLFDFSRCRALHDPSEQITFCPTSMDGFSFGSAAFHLHPSCLQTAQNETDWVLLRARYHRTVRLAERVMKGCPLDPDDPSRRGDASGGRALPSGKREEFILLTCMQDPSAPATARPTEGQRGLIQWDPRLLNGVGPRGYTYTVEEVRTVEEGALFWKTTRQERFVRKVLTTDPEEIQRHRAQVEETSAPFRWSNPQEQRAGWELARTLAEDALRNQRDRFRIKRSSSVPSAGDASVLSSVWALDCVRRTNSLPDGAAFSRALQEWPGAQQAFERCQRQELPVLEDTREATAFRAACSRLLQPWSSSAAPQSEEDVDESDDSR